MVSKWWFKNKDQAKVDAVPNGDSATAMDFDFILMKPTWFNHYATPIPFAGTDIL